MPNPEVIYDNSEEVTQSYIPQKNILLFSFALTWGIGLFPPLLIRFVILKRPIKSAFSGFAVVACFWFLNVLIFTAMGSTSKTHGALFLVGWISYVILRKGSLRDTDKEEKCKAEEKKSSEEFQQEKNGEQKKQYGEQNYYGNNKHVKDEKYYRDFFDLSGNYNIEDIKRRYRELATKYHPDKVSHLGERIKETAENEMTKINEAYGYFKNKYDFS